MNIFTKMIKFVALKSSVTLVNIPSKFGYSIQNLKMKLTFVLAIFTWSMSNAEKERVICTGMMFDGMYYDKRILLKDLGQPSNLLYHIHSGLLFFSHHFNTTFSMDFKIMACYLKNNNSPCFEVMGIPGGFAIAQDYNRDDIYFGGNNGIYKYNFTTNRADFFAEKGVSIWAIFVRQRFFYIEYPSMEIYYYKKDKFVKVPDFQGKEYEIFFISKTGEVYFSNKTALYKMSAMNIYSINVVSVDLIIRQLVEDYKGTIYIVAKDGVYVEEAGKDKIYHSLRKVAEIDDLSGLTFGQFDNPVIGDMDSIYELITSPLEHVCLKAYMNYEIENMKKSGQVFMNPFAK